MDQLQDLEPLWPFAVAGVVALALVAWLLFRRRSTGKSTGKSTDESTAQATGSVATPPADRRGRKATGTTPVPPPPPHVIILADEARTTKLCEVIALRCVRVKTASELLSLTKRAKPVAAFVDVKLVAELVGKLGAVPIVAIVDGSPAESVSKLVEVLGAHPSVAHVLAAPLLASPLGRAQLKNLLERLAGGPEHDLLGAASVGRIAMLAQASRREARFERMQHYFSKQGMSSRTISAIYEVAEELVMNALYNAPTEAGYFKTPVSRMDDVTLPMDRACEVSYGIEAGTAFVRVRDTFGALRLPRLLEVLNRCNSTAVTLDESRGGAGLGIWRVFSAATTIAITVIPGRLTDILIRMVPKQGKTAKQLLAVDLFFLPETNAIPDALALDQTSGLFEQSITMMISN